MFLGTPPSITPLPRREWIVVLDTLLETGQLDPEILSRCSFEQQFCLNEIKKYPLRKKYNERNPLNG